MFLGGNEGRGIVVIENNLRHGAYSDLSTVWARIRADVRVAGGAISPQDAWIAATALGLDAPLATNNRRDLDQVRGLRLLSL